MRFNQSRRKPIAVIIIVIGSIVVAGFYIATRSPRIPEGVQNKTAWEWAQDGNSLQSPDGSWSVRVRFNDGGAMHSGNHWTWLVSKDPSGREHVIAEGFSSPVVRSGRQPMSVRWQDNSSFDVTFLSSRYSADEVTRRVQRP